MSSEIDLMEQKFSRLKSPTKGTSQLLQEKRPEPIRSRSLQQLECMDVEEERNHLPEAKVNFALQLPPTSSNVTIPSVYNTINGSIASTANGTSASRSASFTSSALVPSSLRAAPLVVSGETGITLVNTAVSLSRDDMKRTFALQRNSQNFWKPSFIFPGQDHVKGENRNIFCRESLIRTKQFVCLHLLGCPFGDCLHLFETVDIEHARRRMVNTVVDKQNSKLSAGKTKETLQREHLVAELRGYYDRSTQRFEIMTVPVTAFTSLTMCVPSYLLLLGCTANMARNIVNEVRDDVAFARASGEAGEAPGFVTAAPRCAKDEHLKASNDFVMLREYISSLKSAHEMSPAPGAARTEQTNVAKAPWRVRWDQCVEFFTKSDAGYVPGTEAMLKRAWEHVEGLIALRQMSHAKCTICATGDAKLWHLRGLTSQEAKLERELIERLLKEHCGIHLGARRIMDNHAFLSFTSPRSVWTVLCDAATCRNFLLPKFKFRTPKAFGTRPFWGYKLMAAYAHGFGFFPYLIHNSQEMGANLLWTVAWLTLCKMRKKQGCYADVLFLVLDNTTSENKNQVMLAMAAWLVASGRFKQVRVFFLHVGHAHVIIDQIFGVITVGLRRQELLLPEDLIANIEATLAKNPKYMAEPVEELHQLWDFTRWVKSQMAPIHIKRICGAEQVADEAGAYHGMKDFIFNAGTRT